MHDLKASPDSFDDVVCGVKCFEVQPDDRAFAIGDDVVLHEWDPHARVLDQNQVEHIGAYTGRMCRRRIRYLLRGQGHGVTVGYVVMGLVPPG